MQTKWIALTCVLLGLTGCQNDPVESDDAEIMIPDAGPGDMCAAPTGGFGTSEGRNFLPFDPLLQRCDGSDFDFYGEAEGYCDATFTVLSIAAGWCGPCREEARLMQAQLVDGYAEHGVRVVVAIIQNNDYAAPDLAFCDGWVSQYGLTNPVLIDPQQQTQVYFPGNSLPATLIVDSQGVIRHREYGVSMNLVTVRAALDELLGL